METALTFNDIIFSPVNHQNSLWIRAVELANALGFKREDQAAKIYRAHTDEFTTDMAQVVEITDNAESAFPVKSLLFSLRGCHLLAMFARTPVAKAFRKWVLDVLDRLAAEERAALPSSDTLTPEQQAQLQAIVAAKAGMVPASHRRRAFQEIWARFNNNFQIARYAQLPPARIGEAVEYLVSMEVKAAKALPPTDKESLTVAAPTALPFRADFPADMGRDRREAMQRIERIARDMHTSFTVVRNIVRLGCHPGSKTMRMSLDEREAYETLHNLYTTADESLCAAYNALDAGYKLGRLYGRG
ncbi:BRO family protein [uncultured Desulfovibrio sp.]|uniref:BRO family protein n=1 Tax=uncultured Desulfovibrio sp. TaxID=167968 RepID=UPI0026DC8A69|nr:BRO family protein [uncultured Desulfovibrio sp.]